MEQNAEDPGSRIQEPPATSVDIDAKKVYAARILSACADVFCIQQRLDRTLARTAVYTVPEVVSTKSIPVKRRRLFGRQPAAPGPQMVKKQCWRVGKVFDAKATTPQEVWVASDGTPYYAFANPGGKGMHYVIMSDEFLCTQSTTILSHTLGAVEKRLKKLRKRREKGKVA